MRELVYLEVQKPLNSADINFHRALSFHILKESKYAHENRI